MDNLTHSLIGAVLGQCGLKRKTGLAMPALIIGANLPDVDAACFFWMEGQEHLAFRRGITHGPPAWLLLPLVLAAILWSFDRWQAKRGKRPTARLPMSFAWLYLLGLIACLTHPAMDWMNNYGVRLLAPFSQRWFYGDVLFIIDPWLLFILGAGIWLSRRREKAGGDWKRPARVALTGMLAYIGVNAGITYARESALAGQGEIVIANAVPVAFWQREMIVGGNGRYTVGGEPWGDFDMTAADKPDIARAVPQAAPFLFWSRTPLVHVADDGRYLLRDARYLMRGTGTFTVELPAEVCAPMARPPE
ncbi:MAG: metal-dependent hydrolase [Alteraurantiacibacter sp.]